MKTTLTILLVDDDTDDIEIFIDAVKEIDPSIQCTSALNGREALEKLQSTHAPPPDYIFLDLNMPRMNGRECLASLKQDVRFANIPVIIYTTSKAEQDIEETSHLGADAFLTKPIKSDDLKKAIKAIVNKFKV